MAERKGRVPVKKVTRRKREPEKPSALAPKAEGPPRQMNLPSPVRGERPPMNLPARPAAAKEPEDKTVPEGIVQELASARGWILFAAVLQFIACAGIFLAMGFAGFLTFLAGRGDGTQPFAVNQAVYMGIGGVIGCLLLFLLFLGLGLRMTGFAASVRALSITSEEEDLEAALIYMRRFWQLIGASFLAPILGTPLVFLFSKLVG